MGKQLKHFYEFGPFRLEPDERQLLRQSEAVPLAPKTFDLLLALVEESGHLLGKDDLLKKVWPDQFVEEANLSHNIYKLREALGEGSNGDKYIETIPRRGYRFVSKVTEVHDEPAAETLVIEHSKAQIIVAEDDSNQKEELSETATCLQRQSIATALPLQLTLKPTRKRNAARLALLCLLVVVIALVAYLLLRGNAQKPETASSIRSIAVLPFRPIAAGNRDESLELGMADTLINRLSSLPQLSVRPVSAVRKYEDLQQDAVAAGKELAVDSVLDGSIQRVDDQLRVTVRLIRVLDGETLWAEKFDQKYTDIFVVQDMISERVAQALAQKLSGDERARLVKRYTENTDAYQLYLRARYFSNRSTAESLRKAIDYFQQAIAIDPNYALAYAGLAEAYNSLGLWNFLSEKEAFPQAKTAAQQALNLDHTLADAHAELAYVKFRYDWDYAGAEAEYKEAIALNPNDATAHFLYGEYLVTMQRFAEATREQQRAQELDPLSLPNKMMIAARLYFMRQYDQAISQLQQIIEMDQGFVVAYDLLWASYREAGKFDESVAARMNSLKLQGYTDDELKSLREAYAVSGRQGFWRKDIELIKAHSRQQTSPFIFLAMNYALLDDKDQAFALLETAYNNRNSWLPELKADPVWDGLRSDPRFSSLLRRVNLAP